MAHLSTVAFLNHSKNSRLNSDGTKLLCDLFFWPVEECSMPRNFGKRPIALIQKRIYLYRNNHFTDLKISILYIIGKFK